MGAHAWIRLGKFTFVGMLGAALQLASIYWLTNCLHLSAVLATPVAVEIAVLHNFAWHERFTWADRTVKEFRKTAMRLWRFHFANGVISLAGNTLLIFCLVERLHIPVLPSAVAAIAVCAAANFLLADRWVFQAAADNTANGSTLG